MSDDIRALEQKIAELKKREEKVFQSTRNENTVGTLALGMRIAVELLSAVIVGGTMGLVVDRMFDTKPVFMAMFLLFGGAAGFLNVYRLSKADEKKNKE